MFSQKRIAVFLILSLFFVAEAVAQCAICKQAAASTLDNDPNSIAKGLNTGILYLLTLPYLLIAFIFRKQIVSLWKSWRGKSISEKRN